MVSRSESFLFDYEVSTIMHSTLWATAAPFGQTTSLTAIVTVWNRFEVEHSYIPDCSSVVLRIVKLRPSLPNITSVLVLLYYRGGMLYI